MGHQTDTPAPIPDVPRHTRLHRRGSAYYLRAKVPVDLQKTIGKKELKWFLKTSDPKVQSLSLRRERGVITLMRSLRRRREGKQMSFARIGEELNRQGVPTRTGHRDRQLRFRIF
jgi:hypothetical protein